MATATSAMPVSRLPERKIAALGATTTPAASAAVAATVTAIGTISRGGAGGSVHRVGTATGLASRTVARICCAWTSRFADGSPGVSSVTAYVRYRELATSTSARVSPPPAVTPLISKL